MNSIHFCGRRFRILRMLLTPLTRSLARSGRSGLARPFVLGVFLASGRLFAQEPATGTTAVAAEAAPSAVPAEAGTSAVESQRERLRVLQKRNPIASEYQVIGELGLAPGGAADGERVDFRSLFPLTGGLLGQSGSSQASVSYLYQSASQKGEPGFTMNLVRSLGPVERPTTLRVRANVTAADRRIDASQWNWVPTGFDFQGQPVYFLERPRMQSENITTRTRTFLLHGEHRLSPAHTVFAQVDLWDYKDRLKRNILEYRLGGGQALPGRGDQPQGGTTIVDGAYTNARLRRSTTEEDIDRDRLRLQLGGQLSLGEWEIGYALYHGRWRENRSIFWAAFDNDAFDVAYTIGSDPYFPIFDAFSGTDQNESGASLFRDARPIVNTTRDTDWAGRVDLERRVNLTEGVLFLRSGWLYREKERRKRLLSADVYLRNPAAPLLLSTVRAAGDPRSILKDHYLLPAGSDLAALRAKAAAGDPALQRDEVASILEGLPDNYAATEQVNGLYLASLWRRGRWSFDAGLRGERTETETLGTAVYPVAEDPGIGEVLYRMNDRGRELVARAVPAANRYTTWLPSAGLSFAASPAWTFRGAFFEQLMRPQYFDIVQYRIVRSGTLQIQRGNPDLEPTRVRTLSAAADYRTPRLGTLSFELYRIAVDKFFYTEQTPEIIEGVLYTAKRVENGGAATLQGFQAQWKRSMQAGGFEFEPSAAYTYSDSEAAVPTRPADTLSLPQRSRHLLQLGLDWSVAKFGGNWAISYQSRSLDEVGPGADRDIYRDTVFSLDAGLWWQVNARWKATLAAQNLTDHPERAYEGVPQRDLRNEYSSTTWTLGLAAAF